MEKIGEQLSAARKLSGITVSDAAARLRIRTMFVQALEREEWTTIGEFVYVRGFLKNYAKLLGLDPTPLLRQLPKDYQPEALEPRPIPDPFANTAYPSGRPESETRPGRWFPWVLGALTTIAAVLVVMVGIGLVGFLAPSARDARNAPETNAQATAAALPQATAAANTLEASSDAQNQGSGVNLRLQLTQRSWLSVTVDGKRVVYETLEAGTVREFHGAREITLRAGNAGGVVANIDGRDLGKLGQAGQVEDRVFAVKTPADQLTGAHE